MVIDWKCWAHVRSGSQTSASASSVSDESESVNLDISESVHATSSQLSTATTVFSPRCYSPQSPSAQPFRLPSDIVWLIASAIASTDGEPWVATISTVRELARFRLVCRDWNIAGKIALIKALSESNTELRLPPRSGSLSDLRAVICDGGFGTVIGGVKILLHPVFQSEDLEQDIRGVFQRAARCERRRFPWSDIEATVSFNSARIRHQCQQQEEWYRDAYSPAGMTQLLDIFQAISPMQTHTEYAEHRVVYFEQFRYWWGKYEFINKFVTCPHPMTGNFMLRVLTELCPGHADFTQIDLPSFEVFPDLVASGSAAGSLSLESLNCFDFEELRFPALTPGVNGHTVDYWTARRLGSFLSCARNLQSLSLDLDAPDQCTLQDKVWLNNIFTDLSLPELCFLHIAWAAFDVEHLVTFLTKHNLDVLQLQNVRAGTPNDLLLLVRHMLSLNCFRSAEVTLNSELEHLAGILNELRTLVENREHDGHNSITNPARVFHHDPGILSWLRCGTPRWQPTAAQDQQ